MNNVTTQTLRWLFIRAWRIRLARIVMKLAGGLMTVAENLAPPDLRR
jgi:hypothetical protein